MAACLHRVRRQRWSVRASDAEQALAIRKWLHDHCDGEIKDALEAAFDRVAPGEQVIRLERVVLNLRVGDISLIGETLSAQLADAIAARQRSQGVSDPMPTQGPAASAEEQLVQYLLSGSVSWPIRPDSSAVVPALAAVARTSASAVAAALSRLAPSRRVLGTAIFRLLQLIDESGWADIITAAGGSAQLLSSIDGAARTPGRSHAEAVSPDRRLRLVASRLMEDKHASASPQSESNALALGRSLFDDTPAAATTAAGMRAPGRVDQPPFARTVERSTAGAVRDEAVKKRTNLDPAADRDAIGGAFPIAVAHAGLIVLHPFLPQFFQTVGLSLDSSSDPESPDIRRAAALLNFIATGRDEPHELELGLVKVLIGLAPDTPLPVGAGLVTDSDRAEADALLAAAVDHWGALKQTSIDAVRSSFLQRPGLVKADDNGWRLLIEPGPFDVLLKRLPWSLVLVKLPWMHTPLHCDWPTP